MNNRTFQVTCWPDTEDQPHDEQNPVYRNYEVTAKHARAAALLADVENEDKVVLPARRRHMITPVENAV